MLNLDLSFLRLGYVPPIPMLTQDNSNKSNVNHLILPQTLRTGLGQESGNPSPKGNPCALYFDQGIVRHHDRSPEYKNINHYFKKCNTNPVWSQRHHALMV